MSVTVAKIRDANFMEGVDLGDIPARYGVYVEGDLVGLIHGSPRGYRQRSTWYILTPELKTMHTARRLSEAKQWAVNHTWEVVVA